MGAGTWEAAVRSERQRGQADVDQMFTRRGEDGWIVLCDMRSDNRRFGALGMLNLLSPLFDDRITLYHYGEMFPSIENWSNYYFTMDNGIRLKILGGLVSGFQVTTRYNSQPAAGTTNTDNLYLLTLGYSFDTTRKR
jgi:hypothetical protein